MDHPPDVRTVIRALGDPTRLAVFEHLRKRPTSVGRLAVMVQAGKTTPSRPAVSQHLKVLKDAGLILSKRAGNRIVYTVSPDGVDALRAWINQFKEEIDGA